MHASDEIEYRLRGTQIVVKIEGMPGCFTCLFFHRDAPAREVGRGICGTIDGAVEVCLKDWRERRIPDPRQGALFNEIPVTEGRRNEGRQESSVSQETERRP